MGRDKSRLRWDGRSLARHVQSLAAQLDLPTRIIRRDLTPGCGPLGGVYTALVSSSHAEILFLACDMPFVTPGLLARLIKAAKGRAVFTRSDHGAGFPFLLTQRDLPAVEAQLAGGIFSVQQLARKCRARLMRCEEADRVLFNVNTPADWKTAKMLLRPCHRTGKG